MAQLHCERSAGLEEVFEPPRRIEAREIAIAPEAEYEVSPESHVKFTLGPNQRQARGRLGVTRGRLRVAVDNLVTARGNLTFDLAGLALDETSYTDESADRAEPGSLTEQSLRWLELDSAAAPSRPDWRFAHVSLLRLGVAAIARARDGQPVPAPEGAARRVELRATGELELHGIRAPYTAALVLTFHWPESADATGPAERIELETREPVLIDLLAHRIAPRNARGEVLAESLAELQKRPAGDARISVHWTARLRPTNESTHQK